MKLLKKEFTLCMHPTGYIMLLMSAFVLIPGYPYTVSCSRILLCCCLELAQMVLMGLMILVKFAIGTMPNPAGLDAGVALIGDGFITYAIFNMIFFPRYYRDINKPGQAFMFASVAVFVWIAAVVVFTYAVPFFRDVLDQPDPAFMSDKLLFVLGGAALYFAGTVTAARRSEKKFAAVDLNL